MIVRAAAELELLFIRRSEREGDPWSGHVAFPGGRRSADDPDLPATEDFRSQWQHIPDNAEFPNGFRAQWEP